MPVMNTKRLYNTYLSSLAAKQVQRWDHAMICHEDIRNSQLTTEPRNMSIDVKTQTDHCKNQ